MGGCRRGPAARRSKHLSVARSSRVPCAPPPLPPGTRCPPVRAQLFRLLEPYAAARGRETILGVGGPLRAKTKSEEERAVVLPLFSKGISYSGWSPNSPRNVVCQFTVFKRRGLQTVARCGLGLETEVPSLLGWASPQSPPQEAPVYIYHGATGLAQGAFGYLQG